MNISAVFALGLLLQSPLPRPVATLTITTGSVKIERKVGAPPKSDSKNIRLRNGDRVTVVEKGRMTVFLDKTGATWRLPDSGQFEAKEGILQGLNGAKAVLVQQGKTVTRRPVAPSTVVTDKIRGGGIRIEPFGAVEKGPLVVQWTKMPGAGKATVEILDSKEKSLWKQVAEKGTQQVSIPAGIPKPGTWARIRVSQPEVTSSWVYILTDQERTEVTAAETTIRASLKEDPQALGLALGNLWAEFRLASKLPIALKMVFDDPESGSAQWQLGEWLEQAGFPGLALAAYEAGWNAGERDGLLQESIQRLGGKAEVPEWETLAAERDQKIAEGNLKEALPLAERVVGLLQSAKPESRELALALRTTADMQSDLQMYAESDKNFGAAIALFQRLNENNSGEAARTWSLWGYSALARRDLDLAQQRYETALAIQKGLNPESREVASTLMNLGNIGLYKGELGPAEDRYQAALAVLQKIAPDSLSIADLWTNLGIVASYRSDMEAAQKRYEAALAFSEKYNPGSLDVANALGFLGSLAYFQGSLDLAEKRYEASLKIREKLAPGSVSVADTLNNLGNVAFQRGDLDLAQRGYEAALAVYEGLALESSDIGASLSGLGNVAFIRGDLPLAQKRFEAAYATFEKYKPGSWEVATVLDSLGTVARTNKDFILARKLTEAALAIREKIAPGSFFYADSITNLGTLEYDLGNLESAKKRFEEALAIQEKIAPGSLALANILNNLGTVSNDLGDLALAQDRYEKALSIQQNLVPESLDVVGSLSNLGMLARIRKDENKLMELQQKRLQAVTRLLETQGASRSGDLGALGTAATEAVMRVGVCLDPTSFYSFLPALRGAGLTLQTRYRFSQRLRASDQGVQEAVSALQVAAKKESDWVTTPRSPEMDEKVWNNQLVELRAKRQSAELTLSAILKEKDSRLGRDTLRIDLNQVKAGLQEDETLVEFLRIDTWDDKTRNVGANAYGAFLVAKDGPVRFVRLGLASEIDALVEAWQDQMALATDPEAGEGTLSATENELKSIGRKLHDRLIKPLGKLPPNILIAPDSKLHGLSFDALVDGKGLYLVESKRMSIVGSGRDLVEKPIAGEPGPPAVIAGPNFNLGSAEVAASNAGMKSETSVMRGPNSIGTWSVLPGALEEGRIVARKLGVSPIEESLATEERLMTLVRPRVLHIATHGNFDPPTVAAGEREDLRRSGLVGANLRVADNPMIRSALIMAGANNEAALRKEGLQDGWATALELSQMDLRGTELVVLSACNTAKGDVRGADGVFGLQRAFRFAGAQTLVMSLFKVPDASTLKLMEQFYGAWKPGDAPGSKLTALRGAQLAMLKDPKTRHPRNWSAFVLMGNR